jgi:hypothetical protein
MPTAESLRHAGKARGVHLLHMGSAGFGRRSLPPRPAAPSCQLGHDDGPGPCDGLAAGGLVRADTGLMAPVMPGSLRRVGVERPDQAELAGVADGYRKDELGLSDLPNSISWEVLGREFSAKSLI